MLSQEILDKATMALGGKKKPKKKLRMTINQTDDKRFHVVHNHFGEEPMEESEHAPSNLDELLAHVKEHYSDKEKPEPAEKPEGDSKE